MIVTTDGVYRLVYAEYAAGSSAYGHVHYVVQNGSTWTDTPVPFYTHDPALATTSTNALTILGHGHPLNTACQSMSANLCAVAQNTNGTWGTPQVIAVSPGNDSFDSSPSVKWSTVGWNRPETIEFLFFSANGGSYFNTSVWYARLPTSTPTSTSTPTATPTATNTSTATSNTPAPTTPPPTTLPPPGAPPATATNTSTATSNAPAPTTPPPTTLPPPGAPPPTSPPAGYVPPAAPPGSSSELAAQSSIAMADLAIKVKSDPGLVLPGETVTFVITLTNTGTAAATGLTVVDALPDPLLFIAANAGQNAFQVNGNTVTFTPGSLDPGQSITLSVVARVRADVRPPIDIINVAVVFDGRGRANRASVLLRVTTGMLPGTGEHPDEPSAQGWLPIILVSAASLAAGLVQRAIRSTAK